MTYLTRPTVRLPAPAPALGGWAEDIASAIRSQSSDVDAKCHAASEARTAALDAQTNDLARTWAADNGLYTVASLSDLRTKTMSLLLAASRALEAALPGATTDLIRNIRQAQGRIQSKLSDSLKFTNAINEANAKGVKMLNAPDFKAWVINSMNKASSGLGFATYANCIKPGLLLALINAFQVAWDAVVIVAKKLVRFAGDVANLALEIPRTATDILKYLKYGALAAAGYFVYTKLKHA